jgi:hypothetical protein
MKRPSHTDGGDPAARTDPQAAGEHYSHRPTGFVAGSNRKETEQHRSRRSEGKPEDGIDVGFVIEIGAEIPVALVPIRRWIAI